MGLRWPKLHATPKEFSKLAQALGLSPLFNFYEVFSLREPEIRSTVPQPALAVVILFPNNPTFQKHREDEEAELAKKERNEKTVVSCQDSTPGAGAFYGVLHATANGEVTTRHHPNSLLRIIAATAPAMDGKETSKWLCNDAAVERVYRGVVARKSWDELDLEDDDESEDMQYVCFVQVGPDKSVYELDNHRLNPVYRGKAINDNFLDDANLHFVHSFVDRAGLQDATYHMMVLAEIVRRPGEGGRSAVV